MWLAANPGVPELNLGDPTIRITIDVPGRRFWIVGGPVGWVGNPRVPAGIQGAGPDTIRLVASRDDHGCRTGNEGLYRWSLSPDGHG